VRQRRADGLSVINTLLGMVIDTDRMRPVLGGVTGGLSGPAIRPVAVRCVWQVHQALPDVPILGMGGIRTGLDALEFVLAGAAPSASAPPSSATRPAPVRRLAELPQALQHRGLRALLRRRRGSRNRPAGGLRARGPDPVGDDEGQAAGPLVRAPIAVALDAPDLDTACPLGAGGHAARRRSSRWDSSCSAAPAPRSSTSCAAAAASSCSST
jgi:hypothetical protein